MAEELLTIKQVAAELQMHPDTIRRYIREGKLTQTRVGMTAIRIKRSDLDKFLAGETGQSNKED